MTTKQFLLTRGAAPRPWLLTIGSWPLAICLWLLCTVSVSLNAQTYWNGTADKVFSGSGTQADPYLISTAEQLAGLAERTNTDKEDFAGKYFKLTADIYLTDFTSTDTANWKQWEPIGHILMQWDTEESEGITEYAYFRGHFDGDGHTIYNLYTDGGIGWGGDWDPNDWDMDVEDYDLSVMSKALFGNAANATIENVRIANAKMAAVSQAFLVLNAGAGTTVRNCHVQGEMRGTQGTAAGLVNNNKGLIEDCSVNITFDVGTGGGAFVETNESTGVIRNCQATGSMRFTSGDGAGFVCTNYGLIERCTADVSVQAIGGYDVSTNAAGGHTFRFRSGAGFVLTNQGGTIRECAAFGSVANEGTSINHIWRSAAAGFAYRNWASGRIESCYCTGALRDISDSTNVGGDPTLATFCYDNGYDAAHDDDPLDRGDIINCYSASTVRHHDAESGKNSIHAFVGTFHAYGGFDADLLEPSSHIGCYFNQSGLPSIGSKASATWNGTGKSLSEMQSQAFVDTLNLLASFMGTSQWELREGLPRPTGVYQTNTAALFGGGDGTKANPYIISTKQHLLNLARLVNQGMTFNGKYLLQTADIALNLPQDQWEYEAPTRWTPIGSPRSNPWYENTQLTEFKGVYDGGFHEIQNLYISNLLEKQGLFGRLSKGAELRNLGVTGAYIRAAHLGILAGEMTNKPRIIQCWTSGDIATTGQGLEAKSMGALVGSLGEGAYVLNCSTSAKLTGNHNPNQYIYNDAVYGGQTIWAQDTLVNFLFTGCINNGNGSYGSFQHKENFFADKEKAKIEQTGDGNLYGTPGATVDSTRWMQSKDLVNIYNYSVARWNERHAGNDTLQLHYWEWREGDYPRVSPDASFRPLVTITFNSNGGAPVTTKYVYPDSEVLPPQRPLRDGYIFAGWYKDAGLTQFFDWNTERPTNSITLYARWHEDKRFEVDITPFQNEFTKTYHIKTAAQLRGFAAMQNGIYTWDDNVPCYDDNQTYASDDLVKTQAPISFKGKTVVLDNDILLCDTADWQYWGKGAFGLPWKPIASPYGVYGETAPVFAGTFDGQGHVIFGMYIERNGMPGWSTTGEFTGLFGAIGDSAVVRNVGIEASVIDGQEYNTRGQKNDAVWYWRRCSYGEQGWDRTGMLIGKAQSFALIEQCYAVGNIYTQSTGDYYGGLIGQTSSTGSTQNEAIRNCFARVNIQSSLSAPDDYGFTFMAGKAPVSHCYSAGQTYKSFCSTSNATNVTGCYYDKSLVSVQEKGTPATTNEMHAMSTFADWDFETIWGRNDTINDGYPYLRIFRDETTPNSPDPATVTGITLQETKADIVIGDSIQLHASVLPADAANQKIIWSSSNAYYATVTAEGVVKALAYSTTPIVITATTEEGGYAKRCTLNIQIPTLTFYSQPIKRRQIGSTTWKDGKDANASYILNYEYIVAAYSSPDAAHTALQWQSSDETVITVEPYADDTILTSYSYAAGKNIDYHSSWALIRCIGAGSAVITATNSKYDLTATRSFTVRQYDVESITITSSSNTLDLGTTRTLTVGTTPAETSYPPVITWTSSAPDIISVDETGRVTALEIGSATITAACGTATASVTLTVPPVEATAITMSETEVTMYVGDTHQLSVTFTPENTTDKSVTWSTSSARYATVDGNGLVTANRSGSVTITAKTSNNKTATCRVTVQNAVNATAIALSQTTATMELGETLQLTATLTPSNATTQVVWSSSNEEVLSVDENGLVTAEGIGTATVTATAGSKSASCVVTVQSNTFYTITFVDDDETLLWTTQVREGEVPVYAGPAIAADSTVSTVYTFAGWTPALAPATSDATYTAVYAESPRTYTVRFLNWNGAVLQSSAVAYGGTPTYTGAMPTRPEDEEYTYAFSGWSPEIVPVSADADYTAQFKATAITYYAIRFLNYDGTELQSSQVKEGDTPVYTGATPTRPEDETYTYTFSGWSPAIVAATADADYTVTYEATAKPQPKDYTPQNLTVVSNTATSLGASVMLQWNMVQGVEMYELIVREGDNDILNVNTGFYTQYAFDLTSDNLPYGTHTLTWFVRSVVHYEPVSDYAEGPAFVVTIPQTHDLDDQMVNGKCKNEKILIDGVLYIVRPDGTMYNAQGARVK